MFYRRRSSGRYKPDLYNPDPFRSGKRSIYLQKEETSSFPAKTIGIPGLEDTRALKIIAGLCQTPYLLLYTKSLFLQLSPHALERFIQVAKDTSAAFLYSDYYEIKEQQTVPHPLIDYQPGSVRDDFQFGSVLFFATKSFKEAVNCMEGHYNYSALYDLRLKIAQKGEILRIPEYLYTEQSTDTRSSGYRIFDYVTPSNRNVQIEREGVFTQYLKIYKPGFLPLKRKFPLKRADFRWKPASLFRLKTANVLFQKLSSLP